MKRMLIFGLATTTVFWAMPSFFSLENGIFGARPEATKNGAARVDMPKIWAAADLPQRTLDFPAVGTIHLFGNMVAPASVVLFLSGDGGWNLGVVDMAKALAADGQTLVAGFDLIKYYKKLQAGPEKCLYPAGDLENLSEFLQKKLGLPIYQKPVLVGYSSGATLTYALLCQAPVGTFRGGIALGFCPDVQLEKPLCEGSGKLTMARRKDGKGFDFTDEVAPGAPLEVLQGDIDGDCPPGATVKFFEKIGNVGVTRLPKVGHGFAVEKNWMPQFKAAFSKIIVETAPAPKPSGPGKQVAMAAFGPAPEAENGAIPWAFTEAKITDNAAPMVVFLSGDGGWTGFDQQICDQFASKKCPTIGLDCQSYFWKKKTPEQAAADLAPEIEAHLKNWGKSGIVLIGYSFGANVAPFIFNRFPLALREKVEKMVLLSPDEKGDFEVHIAGMLGKAVGGYDVVAEVKNIQGPPVVCVAGDQETTGLEAALKGTPLVSFEKIPGSHHYNNDAQKVATTVFPER